MRCARRTIWTEIARMSPVAFRMPSSTCSSPSWSGPCARPVTPPPSWAEGSRAAARCRPAPRRAQRLDARRPRRSPPPRSRNRRDYDMTVYPFVLHLGPLELTGYGLMMMVAFLMAGWAIQLDLRQRGLDEDYAADIVIAGVVGGLVGDDAGD